jgi:hypothetical protein
MVHFGFGVKSAASALGGASARPADALIFGYLGARSTEAVVTFSTP